MQRLEVEDAAPGERVDALQKSRRGRPGAQQALVACLGDDGVEVHGGRGPFVRRLEKAPPPRRCVIAATGTF